ncbi:hypothetical protein WJU23_22150 [Prosthecobacter sp. SYSU 5D2]|uniref:hypothetical protein n=1 Tax=Prosthecobacter sp. SYSU 5D2 TaxID=3134134 RepID=UPI0031FF4337
MTQSIRRAGTAAMLAFLASCSTPKDATEPVETLETAETFSSPAAETPAAAPTDPAVSLSERSLLEMTFEEAQALSPQNLQVGPLYRVAADAVEVLKTDRAGNPVKVLAKGHVFLEMDLGERATGLCDEATVSIRDILLEGNPMVKQGVNVAKSTSEKTTMFIHYDRLNIRGRYEIVKLEDMPLF